LFASELRPTKRQSLCQTRLEKLEQDNLLIRNEKFTREGILKKFDVATEEGKR
jgi:hypothetical protein